jgi:hypothetical protein
MATKVDPTSVLQYYTEAKERSPVDDGLVLDAFPLRLVLLYFPPVPTDLGTVEKFIACIPLHEQNG